MVRSDERHKMAVCVITAAILLLVFSPRSWGAAADEWKKVVEAAKKEGKVVVSIPASSELRKQMEPIFEQRFPGIDLELHSGTASAMQRKISDEFAAGVRYFDLHMGGAVTMINGFVGGQIVDPIEPNLLLPEVIDAKNWWGGHMAIDKEKRFTYLFSAFLVASFWHNTKLANATELRSYDDLLSPKWKGKIGWLDPRQPGAAPGSLGVHVETQRRGLLEAPCYTRPPALPRPAGDDESLAREKLAVTIGVSHYSYRSFVSAGLPGEPPAHFQRRNLWHGGFRDSSDYQESPPSQRHQGVRQLAARQRGQEIGPRA